MKKTLYVDDELLEQARSACEASTDTDTVRQGLEALVRNAAYQRLRAQLDELLSRNLATGHDLVGGNC
jgi:Arc/MetJ family transcription regulator